MNKVTNKNKINSLAGAFVLAAAALLASSAVTTQEVIETSAVESMLQQQDATEIARIDRTLERQKERLEDENELSQVKAVHKIIDIGMESPAHVQEVLDILGGIIASEQFTSVRRVTVFGVGKVGAANVGAAYLVYDALDILRGLLDGTETIATRGSAVSGINLIAMAHVGLVPEILDIFDRLREDENANIRGRIAYSTYNIGLRHEEHSAESFNLLQELLEDKDGSVRKTAVHGIGLIAQEYPSSYVDEAFDLLAPFWDDEDMRVQGEAREHIGNITKIKRDMAGVDVTSVGNPGIVTMAYQSGFLDQQVREVPGVEERLKKAISLLGDEDIYISGNALNEVIDIGVEYAEHAQVALDALVPVLNDGDDNVLWGVILGAGRIALAHEDQSQQVFDALKSFIDNKGTGEYVRLYAVNIIGKIGVRYAEHSQDVLAVIVPFLDNDDWGVRASVAFDVGLIGIRHAGNGQSSFDALKPLLEDKNSYVRATIAEIVGWIGLVHDEMALTVLDELMPLLDDDDPFVRWSTVARLGWLGLKYTEHAQMIIGKLEPLLQDQDDGVSKEAAKSISMIKRAVAYEALLKENNESSYIPPQNMQPS